MSEPRQVSDVPTWGCLAAGMILSGAFFVILFDGVGGTEYELKYTAEGLVVAGVGILLVLFAKHWRR